MLHSSAIGAVARTDSTDGRGDQALGPHVLDLLHMFERGEGEGGKGECVCGGEEREARM